MKKTLLPALIVLSGFLATSLYGQDSLNILTYEAFLEIVREHHPVAAQAVLETGFAEAELRKARGMFDPVALTDISQKYFKGDKYYSLINAGVKIPTWLGIEFYGGYELNEGVFVNDENSVPQAGLMNAGVSVPLGQDLFIDSRRAQLRKAQININTAEAVRDAIVNDLIFDAGSVYWEWARAYSEYTIFQEALELALIRYEAVTQEALLGDRAAVDTLEAGIQVQNRQLSLVEARVQFLNLGALLSTYLWMDGIVPLEIAETTIPENIELTDRAFTEFLTLDSLGLRVLSHPDVVAQELKIESLEVDERLSKERLKPRFDLKYNAINEPINGNPFAEYSINNYTWGLEFKMPLFLRKERGDLQVARLAIQDAELKLASVKASFRASAQAGLNTWYATNQQIDQYTRTVADVGRLLDAERQLFSLGESSLFLINSREVAYINARLKLVELLAKNQKSILSTRRALGVLN